MKKVLLLVVAAVFVSSGVARAETWKGVIGDSHCGAKHSEERGTDHSACVSTCVDKKGGKYVFVAKDKVFAIANQDFADLKAHAGHVVMLSGEMKGDAITVSKVEMPKADKEKKK
jgi:hypothetical protein